MLWVVKGRAEDHTKPMVRMTPKGQDFVSTIMHKDATKVGVEFERFVFGGVDGT